MTINTLAIAKKLKDSGFTPQQAEAQAEIWSEIVESDLATKRDLKELEGSLKQSIKELDLKISLVEANLKRDIKELELSMEKNFTEAGSQTFKVGLGLALFVITVLGFLFRFLGHA